MKIALIHPSGNKDLKVPPLGLAYITAILKKNNIETQIVDLNVEKTKFSKYLNNQKPDIVGFSSIITNAHQAIQLAKETKKVLPKSFVLMGGPYASMMKSRLFCKHKEVDALLVGEAEYTFLELAKKLQINKK